MDFHVIPPYGEAVLILSTDDQGRIVTPLPAEPPPARPEEHAGSE